MIAWRAYAAGLIALVIFGAGIMTGRWTRKPPASPPAQVTDTTRKEVKHDTGAVTLERIPSTPARPAPPPLAKLPGTETTHEITLTIAPHPESTHAQVDIQEGKDGERVTIAGPGITGTDFTIPRPPPPKVPRWMAGATWDGRNYGPMIGYQWERITAGAYATRNQSGLFVAVRF